MAAGKACKAHILASILAIATKIVSLCRTEKYKNSFIPKAIKEWNNLPEDFKNQPTYDRFKSQLTDKYLGNSLYYNGNRKVNIIHARLLMNWASVCYSVIFIPISFESLV